VGSAHRLVESPHPAIIGEASEDGKDCSDQRPCPLDTVLMDDGLCVYNFRPVAMLLLVRGLHGATSFMLQIFFAPIPLLLSSATHKFDGMTLTVGMLSSTAGSVSHRPRSISKPRIMEPDGAELEKKEVRTVTPCVLCALCSLNHR
jgi:hypothetical protein